jgi:hypothetical protein
VHVTPEVHTYRLENVVPHVIFDEKTVPGHVEYHLKKAEPPSKPE